MNNDIVLLLLCCIPRFFSRFVAHVACFHAVSPINHIYCLRRLGTQQKALQMPREFCVSRLFSHWAPTWILHSHVLRGTQNVCSIWSI